MTKIISPKMMLWRTALCELAVLEKDMDKDKNMSCYEKDLMRKVIKLTRDDLHKKVQKVRNAYQSNTYDEYPSDN